MQFRLARAVALALLGAGLPGKFLQALLTIDFLTFTLRGSHEHVRLAGSLANNAGTPSLKSPCRRADPVCEQTDGNCDSYDTRPTPTTDRTRTPQ